MALPSPDRLVPQTIRGEIVEYHLPPILSQESTKIRIGGIDAPIAAKPWPVKRPPLDPIRPKAMSPSINAIPPVRTLTQATRLTTSDFGLSARGSSAETKPGTKHARAQRAQTNDAIATLLTRTFTRSVVPGACDNTQPQELQNRASSGFSYHILDNTFVLS